MEVVNMPRLNGTGPMGNGPMTGRGRGRCTGARKGLGIDRGIGRGFGRGFRGPEFADVELSKEEERKILEAEKKEIEKRLAKLRE